MGGKLACQLPNLHTDFSRDGQEIIKNGRFVCSFTGSFRLLQVSEKVGSGLFAISED
jgi:hypothetical protein